jgi:hypothetical protein
MIPDLLLALASVAVLLLPVVVHVGFHAEVRKVRGKEEDCWEKDLPS